MNVIAVDDDSIRRTKRSAVLNPYPRLSSAGDYAALNLKSPRRSHLSAETIKVGGVAILQGNIERASGKVIETVATPVASPAVDVLDPSDSTRGAIGDRKPTGLHLLDQNSVIQNVSDVLIVLGGI